MRKTLALVGLLAACGEDVAFEEIGSSSGEVKDGTLTSPLTWRAARVNGGCTGTVIDPWWVLTAVHCLGTKDPNEHTITLSGQVRNVTHVSLHPLWWTGVDVALLRLDQPFTNIAQDELSLWPLDTQFLYGQSATCYGYGATDVGGACDDSSDCASGWFCKWGVCMESSGGVLNRATLEIIADPVDPDKWYRMDVPNSSGQMMLPGDSGGSCRVGAFVTGVMKAGNATNYNRQTSAEAFAPWAEKRRDCPGFDPNAPTTGFCTPACPCDAGEGDCDSNSDCMAGLACKSNSGPRFGLPASYDTCEPVDLPFVCSSFSAANPSETFCSQECRCSHSEGDCDDDFDCGGSLVCGNNNGAAVGLPPSYDVCVYPAAPGCPSYDDAVDDPDFCSPQCPCDIGQGDCDSNADCRGGLICEANVGAVYGKPADYDMCIRL
jgi:hypothetical protein